MEDDDDIYPENDDQYEPQDHHEVKMEDAEDGEEGEELEDDSDDDINFITDAKEEPKPELGSRAKSASQLPQSDLRKASSTPLPLIKPEPTSARVGSEIPVDRSGTTYPARHTSKLDPNGNPILPMTGKPVLSIDFDTDFPNDSDKPWRRPGADITDFFNYGFDEFTWASYCLKQQQMPKEIKEINQQAEQMKNFVEGIPGGAMPGMPGIPSGPATGQQMPGMPNDAEMQQMFQSMMAQGMDPTTMDPNQFMQMMMGGGGAAQQGFGGQPPSQPMGFGNEAAFNGPGGGGGGGGGGFGGRGRGRGGRRW